MWEETRMSSPAKRRRTSPTKDWMRSDYFPFQPPLKPELAAKARDVVSRRCPDADLIHRMLGIAKEET